MEHKVQKSLIWIRNFAYIANFIIWYVVRSIIWQIAQTHNLYRVNTYFLAVTIKVIKAYFHQIPNQIPTPWTIAIGNMIAPAIRNPHLSSEKHTNK